jgi:hypothetical protein
MTSKAQSLFHLTQEFNTLKSILKSKLFWPRYCLEDYSWLFPRPLAFPMVCFCDIPLARLRNHVISYGHYGLALTKEWGITSGLNPLLYINGKSPFCERIKAAFNSILMPNGNVIGKGIPSAFSFISYMKPHAGKDMKLPERPQKTFYEESEWRYVPNATAISARFAIMTEDIYNDIFKLNEWNQRVIKDASLLFDYSNIRYIFVHTQLDKMECIKYINECLNCDAQEKDYLKSCITCFDDITEDM